MPNAKTNAMRILDRAGIVYQVHTYTPGHDFADGISAAQKLGQPAEKVFKTLVTGGAGGGYFVFIIPVAAELDRKAAAAAVGEKSVALIRSSELLRVTGYVRGGCSPIGMKKSYVSVLDASALKLSSLIISAGKIGMQLELRPADLVRASGCAVKSITSEL